MSPHKAAFISEGNRKFLQTIRERIVRTGRASLRDFEGSAAADQVRVLVSLDVLERYGDELILVDEPLLGRLPGTCNQAA